MDLINEIFELIDMRSFSNLWFWIVLAVMWSTVSHWVLGVPWDMVLRAKKGDPEGIEDLQDMVRISTNRILYIATETGLVLAGFLCFVLTSLFLLGFVYDNQFSQAVFLLAFPMSLIAVLSIGTAQAIRAGGLEGEALYKRLHKHRLITQIIGMLSIFATAMWGMLQNMTAGALG
ncbi:component of SufBCD complex [Roseovarius aestuariivivens]|uniref:component of SufBCD complex n=1 Tax=Roseovarius aestuariivivens TaxID=1888910 RepID=UPI001FDA3FD2|nr:component of SufBCD complex [Roseovarius aestuariivivens]